MARAGTTSCAFLAMRAKVPLARPVRAAAGRKRPVALRAKDGEKQLRKAVRKVVESVESVGREVEELRELASTLREEREALATLVDALDARLGRIDEALGSVDRVAEEEAVEAPETRGEGRALTVESSANVRDDIMGAIARVGFPDGFGAPVGAGEEAPSQQVTADEVSSGPAKEVSSGTVARMPAVTVGCDSIQIMELLHAKLEEKGFYCADDEREDWYFGESTQNAVMSFQASNGLTENGSVTAKEWEVLLEGETDFVWEEMDEDGLVVDLEAAPSAGEAPASPPTVDAGVGPSGFPMLREGDGGKHVRLLQLALDRKGYCVSDDELEFWMFGDTTENALKTFQACSGMPESGVVDEEVWSKLCEGMEGEVCSVEYMEEKTSGTSEAEEADPYNIDRAKQGVFLLGEGRYEDPGKLSEGKR